MDSKTRKISKKVAVIGYILSQAAHTGTLHVHNEWSPITNAFTTSITRAAITTANNHSQISTKSISTQTPSTINAQTAVAGTNSAITLKEIHCICNNLCMYIDNMKSWNEVMSDKKELQLSQRDILKLYL